MKQFVDIHNVEPVWNKINNLYVRKGSDYVVPERIFTLEHQSGAAGEDYPDFDDPTKIKMDYNITQIHYSEFSKFLTDAAAVKYIVLKGDEKVLNVDGKHVDKRYPVTYVFRNINPITPEESSTIQSKTQSVLIRTDIGVFEIYAAHMKNVVGGIGEYKLILKNYLVPLPTSKVDAICDELLKENTKKSK